MILVGVSQMSQFEVLKRDGFISSRLKNIFEDDEWKDAMIIVWLTFRMNGSKKWVDGVTAKWITGMNENSI